jgi:mono/diheme cytochrome c family protein
MTKKHGMIALVGVLLAAGCGPGAEEEAAQRAEDLRLARADSVATAETMYDSSVFDTIQWESQEATLERGALVWRVSCQKCHGMDGRGEGQLAQEHGLQMPDLLAGDWQFAGDPTAIRHRVYVGHESAMPAWGLYGLAYRDVDAVAYHIEAVIRAPATD